ncbi:MAG: prenyltransferase/squalene oxidase repeat-containing protein [Planctomycetota bacterium]|jgi:hypothetical protein
MFLMLNIGCASSLAVDDRTAESRPVRSDALARAEAADDAGSRALAWLRRRQAPDGHWGGARTGAEVITTSRAVIALAYSGATENKKALERAARWLLSQQDDTGAIGEGDGDLAHVTHAMAGQALIVAADRLRTPKLRKAAQEALDHACTHLQREDGGWGMRDGEGASLEATLQFVLLIVDGMGIRLDRRAESPLKAYEYITDGIPEPLGTLHGEAMLYLCRTLLGVPRTDSAMVRSREKLTTQPIPWPGLTMDRGSLQLQIATHVVFRFGGEGWRSWRSQILDVLVYSQEREGAGRGSWPASTLDEAYGWGRVGSTALAYLVIEQAIYYNKHYIPMYR